MAASLLLAGRATHAHSNDFSVQSLAPGVYVHLGRALPLDAPGHDDIANIGFIIGQRCVAVIDTGGSVRTGRALRASVVEHTKLPVCYVINTHVHVDHVLGNAAFQADHPHFVGHINLAAALARSRDFFLQQYGADLDPPPSAAQIVAPDVPVASGLELDLGGRRLQLKAWPIAHTDCDLTVFDEQTGTLWTGDLLFRGRLPALDGSADGWLGVIAQLRRQTAEHVVPGHGEPTTDLAAALTPEQRYLQALLDGVRAQLARGGSMQDAIAQVAADQRPHWLLWDSTHPHNVARVFQQLEWE
ncbi:MAG TPA: quinoprotein relay system zinc metallohydrolase 2 [Steroidobacteraceae bacterium]|jgi:quinoprotein relay system zinc metallohydrolase 2